MKAPTNYSHIHKQTDTELILPKDWSETEFLKNSIIPRTPNKLAVDQEDLGQIVLTEKQRDIYWKSLADKKFPFQVKLNDQEYTSVYGYPLTINKKIVEGIMERAGIVYETVHDRLTNEEILTEYLGQDQHPRAPIFNGKILNDSKINQQFVDYYKQGLMPGFVFDVMLTKDKNGDYGFKVVEMESGHGYNYWIEEIADSARTAIGNDRNDLISSYNNPRDDHETLLNFSNGNPIAVMDFKPQEQHTAPELRLMAQQLGNKDSAPICLSDVYKNENGEWYAYLRDRKNELTGQSVKLEYVLCRSIHADMKNLEQKCRDEGNLEQLEVLDEFLRDSENIKWLSHPSHQNIVDKRDLKLTQENELTEELGLNIYYAGEHVKKPGKYRQKPLNGNGGSDQTNITIKPEESYIVPSGFMCQEYMNFVEFPIESRLQDEIDTATIEFRMMPPICYGVDWKDRGTYVFTRLAPTTSPLHVREHVRTNFTDIVQAVYAIIEKINKDREEGNSNKEEHLEKELRAICAQTKINVDNILTYKDSPFGVTFAFITE